MRSHLVSGLRVVGVLLVLSAEVYLVVQLGERFTPSNHFSYFTVLSNVLAAVVLLTGLVRPVPGPVRGVAVLYMVTTGIVYTILLRGVDVDTPPYANFALHQAMPIIVAADWLADPPPTRISARHAVWWLAFPVAYVGYTLVRGPIAQWYPYPFLDPGNGGYGMVAVMSLVVAVIIGVLAALIVWVGNHPRRRRTTTRES